MRALKQLAAVMMMSSLIGCANTQPVEEMRQTTPTQVTSERWKKGALRGGGDCGAPVLLIEGLPSFDGFNALGLPDELEPGPIEVIIKPVDPAEPRDPRTMVSCRALGPERGWIVIDQWRRPKTR